MKTYSAIFLFFVTAWLTPVCQAAIPSDGICHPVNNIYVYDLNLNGQQIPAGENKAGTEVRDAETLTASSKYHATCDCLTHFTTTFRNIYYTTRYDEKQLHLL